MSTGNIFCRIDGTKARIALKLPVGNWLMIQTNSIWKVVITSAHDSHSQRDSRIALLTSARVALRIGAAFAMKALVDRLQPQRLDVNFAHWQRRQPAQYRRKLARRLDYDLAALAVLDLQQTA